jgi:hypothetical protein
MRTKSLLTALVATAALAGCAALNERLDPYAGCDDPSSSSHVCRVTITVNSCTHGTGSITATPSTRHVKDGTWVIQWTLASPGYEFADDGISVKKPDGIFVKRGKTAAATFLWVDNNNGPSAKGQHAYGVHILKGGAECALYDPDISND